MSAKRAAQLPSVILFSKLNITVLGIFYAGYIHPKTVSLRIDLVDFRVDLTDTSAKTATLVSVNSRLFVCQFQHTILRDDDVLVCKISRRL